MSRSSLTALHSDRQRLCSSLRFGQWKGTVTSSTHAAGQSEQRVSICDLITCDWSSLRQTPWLLGVDGEWSPVVFAQQLDISNMIYWYLEAMGLHSEPRILLKYDKYLGKYTPQRKTIWHVAAQGDTRVIFRKSLTHGSSWPGLWK